jgi:hypothetical protein
MSCPPKTRKFALQGLPTRTPLDGCNYFRVTIQPSLDPTSASFIDQEEEISSNRPTGARWLKKVINLIWNHLYTAPEVIGMQTSMGSILPTKNSRQPQSSDLPLSFHDLLLISTTWISACSNFPTRSTP